MSGRGVWCGGVRVAGIGGMAGVVCAVLGTQIVEFAFGADCAVERQDMVLLAASSAVLMVALSFAQALMACRAQGRMALAWVLGLAVFPLVVALGDDLFLRVELGLLATVSGTATPMAVLLAERPRPKDRWHPMAPWSASLRPARSAVWVAGGSRPASRSWFPLWWRPCSPAFHHRPPP